ncbi:MBL fold metallo-hydrolase [Clostridiaceae bacterium M8S5]|nr:MBL fold metallo-hydrolase [Clostridiaceae bacterium M8S5]
MLKKLTNKIYYMPLDNTTDRPHLGLICGDKYSLVVDSGNSTTHAKEFLNSIKDMDIPPLKYLVITHYHWDHIYGIDTMKLTTIAHKNIIEHLNNERLKKLDDASLDEHVKNEVFSEFTTQCIKAEMSNEERTNLVIGNIDITFEKQLKIDLGGLTCIVDWVGGNHTNDSATVYVPDEKVAFLGDCIYGAKFNGAYGYTADDLIPMLDILDSYNADKFLVSHEEIWDKSSMNEFSNQLRVANELVGKDSSSETAIQKFVTKYKRQPDEEEAFYIDCFANVNKALK